MCRNIFSILIDVITKTVKKIDNTNYTIAFFCYLEMILKDFFHQKSSKFTFFEVK